MNMCACVSFVRKQSKVKKKRKKEIKAERKDVLYNKYSFHYMYCNSVLSIRYGQEEFHKSSNSLSSLFVNVYSEVDVSSTYRSLNRSCL